MLSVAFCETHDWLSRLNIKPKIHGLTDKGWNKIDIKTLLKHLYTNGFQE